MLFGFVCTQITVVGACVAVNKLVRVVNKKLNAEEEAKGAKTLDRKAAMTLWYAMFFICISSHDDCLASQFTTTTYKNLSEPLRPGVFAVKSLRALCFLRCLFPALLMTC